MPIKAPITTPKSDREFAAWCLLTGDTRLISGTGSPETVHTADRGTLFLRTDGGVGSTLYVKETDSVATGWRAL
jgi:hypothetical protein